MRSAVACLAFGLLLATCQAQETKEPKKLPKESPKYKIVGGSAEYEIRKYKPATFITVEVAAVNFDGAVYVGAKPLDKYFDGENVEGKELNLTTPLSIQFSPTVGKAGEFNGTLKDFNVSYLIPAADADKPPTPIAPVGFIPPAIVEAPTFYTYTKKFAGYAFEKAVLKVASALDAALDADGVDLTDGEWVFSKYDGGFLDSRNEVSFVTETKPALKLLTRDGDEDTHTAQ